MSTAGPATGALTGEPFSFRGQGLTLAGTHWPADASSAASSTASSTPVSGHVVLLHGGGQTRFSWSATGSHLAAHGWDTISYDARGHGESEWAADGDYGMPAGVADLRALVATLPEPPVLIGASMGGMVSLLAVGADPALARALVLVDIVARNEPAGIERIRAFMTGRPEGFADLDEVADAVSEYSNQRRRPTNLDGLRKNVRQRADGRWYWHWDPAMLHFGDEVARNARDHQIRTAAAAITIPTLIVRGLQSDVVSEDGVRDLQSLIPGSRYAQVQAGHMVAGDDNDVFTRVVVDFLDEVVG